LIGFPFSSTTRSGSFVSGFTRRDAAIGTEFPARVFLPCRQWMAVLIRPGLFSVLRADFLFYYHRPLQVH